MSTSTVSITANAASRRRTVAVAEKKAAVDLVADGGVSQLGADKNGASSGKDLSNSIRGEAAVERQKDSVQVKETVPNSTVYPRRTRKGALKPEKPRWQTVISVLTKNLLLLLILLGLIQMIRRLALKSTGDGAIGLMDVSDLEGQIAEVKAFMKTTTKMMQVQVEALDRKIVGEVGGLRKEVRTQMENKDIEFEDRLKKLDDKTEILNKAVTELRDTDYFRKEDFEKFLEAFEKAKGGQDRDKNWGLDEVREFAKQVIEKEIERFAADGIGRVDYAVASGGATVTRHSEPFHSVKELGWLSRARRDEVNKYAVKMLQPSFGEPGQCFPLKGNSGFVEIRLRSAIIPEAVTLEHVAKSVAYNRSSAPKDCRVSGWLKGQDGDVAADSDRRFLLTEFIYDLDKSNVQTFNVIDSGSPGLVNMIRLDFTSNHGHSAHTCIYRLRVHGHEPSSVLMFTTQA